MQIRMVYEMNRAFMVAEGEEIEKHEDYRHKMLSRNTIWNILSFEERHINNDRMLYFDITGKESLLNYFGKVKATRVEVRSLFDALYIATVEIGKYMIPEKDLIIRPEMIFKDLCTGKFEFICIPLMEGTEEEESCLNTLIRYIMMNLDNEDEKLVSTIYSINDMTECANIDFARIYEFFLEGIKEEDVEEIPEVVSEPENEEKEISLAEKRTYYVPSFKEVFALSLCIVGAILTGVDIYYSIPM